MATQDWMEGSHWVAVGNEIPIKLSSGPFLSSMSFAVREIWLPDPDLLRIPDLSSDTHDRMQGYASIPSLPYALSNYNIHEVKAECLRYINTISKCPIHLLEQLEGNTSIIVWRSLEAVWHFLRTSLTARQADTLLPMFIKVTKLTSKIERFVAQRNQAILGTFCYGKRYQPHRRNRDYSC
jgi:hypothetical protein